MDQEEKELGFMVMEALALLLSHNQKNASKEICFNKCLEMIVFFLLLFRNLS
jgi:hypothetical protein